MSATRVTKAVIPAAGLGTRFLPATKSQPKEMLPVVDRPAIQYVVEELRATTELGHIHYIRQGDARGLGHAIGVAREHVGAHAFAVLLGDDIMVDDAQLLGRMLDVHERESASVLALMEVPPEQISAYGCVDAEDLGDGFLRIRGIVEKPRPEDAPSNLAVIGRYVLTPEIFDAIDRTPPGVNGEIQITDAIGLLLADQPVFGVAFSEGRYDIGQKLDFLRANVEIALDRPDLGPELAEILVDIVRRRGLA
jgi:UTP--glucose-1-phosphate uridylyltransferase